MSVVTEARYRRTTRDLTTSQADVLDALTEAQGAIEDRLGRPLEYLARMEQVFVYEGGQVFPRATPVDMTQPYSVSGINIFDDAFLNGGYYYDRPSRATVTYTGGWTQQTLPSRLSRAVCLTARHLLDASETPAGLRSAAVGDASVTYDGPTEIDLPPGVWASIKKYAYRELIPVRGAWSYAY
ncbi:hypothetical protein [Fodinicola feengrottensis]|uniref:Uncharacterized protein n=1 Tax=Fodinicola feengrottensis TaxID=435914 RepID=A0ABN2IUZ7_9ACTN|nr:hypothetical protein [Fodinicola feengrottensis]